jgi:tRNA acetyltransferase TAN1
MSNKNGPPKPFSAVSIDLPCVIFFKVRPPIDPVDFVYRICKEIVSTPGIRRMRYINRLSPITTTAKATEKGLKEVGKTVLGQHFQLAGEEEKGEPQPASSVSEYPSSEYTRSCCSTTWIRKSVHIF